MNNLHFTVEKTKAQKEGHSRHYSRGQKKNFLLKGQIVVGILDW